jgi:hypothetical protein
VVGIAGCGKGDIRTPPTVRFVSVGWAAARPARPVRAVMAMRDFIVELDCWGREYGIRCAGLTILGKKLALILTERTACGAAQLGWSCHGCLGNKLNISNIWGPRSRNEVVVAQPSACSGRHTRLSLHMLSNFPLPSMCNHYLHIV